MSPFKKIQIKSKNSIPEEPKERRWLKTEGKLVVDVFETDSEIIVQSAVAGIKPEDFEISIENDMLEIKGTRNDPQESKPKKNYFFQECYWGPFSRQIILPKEIDSAKTQSLIKEGILTIIIPKLKKERKKKLKIKEEE